MAKSANVPRRKAARLKIQKNYQSRLRRLLPTGAVAGSALLLILGMAPPASAGAVEPVDSDAGTGAFVLDHDALNRQNARLAAVEAAFADAAGGIYLDEAAGELVVRYINDQRGAALRARMNSLPRLAGDLPVRFEETKVPMSRLRAATDMLDDDRGWAGADAGRIHQVSLDELTPQIVVHASGQPERIAAAAAKATGFTPQVVVSKAGFERDDSRRDDTGLYNGGMVLWDTSAGSGDDNAFCTAGFRMTRGGNNSRWMTTAGHCGANGTRFFHDGRRVVRVSSNYDTLGTDIAMLAPVENGEAFSRYVWFGGRDTTTKRPVTAKNTRMPVVGSAVFISGGNSGLIHGVVISTSMECNGQRMVAVDTVTGHPRDGRNVGGDSGAPVFAYNPVTSDPNDIRAVGSHTCSDDDDLSLFEPIHEIENITNSVVVIGGN